MSESQRHINLVKALVVWVEERFHSVSYDFFILVDLPDSREKPDVIAGFRPDLFARATDRLTLVGEAKVTADLENPHTRYQVAAFLRYLAGAPGGVFVMATPWVATASAKNLVRTVAHQISVTNVEIHIMPYWGIE